MSNASFTIAEAQLVSLFVESVLYGIYVVSCGYCASALLRVSSPSGSRWRSREELRWLIIAAGVLLFLNTTLNLSLALYRAIQAYVVSSEPGRTLSAVSSWVNVAKTYTVQLQPAIGDLILMYRCYVVYSRNWKIIIPSVILFLGSLSMSAKAIAVQTVTQRQGTINSSEIAPYLMAWTCLIVTQNIVTTSLLVYRIWTVERENREFGYDTSDTSSKSTRRLRRVIRIVTESGLLMTVPSIMTLICRVTSSNVIYPVSAIELLSVGIAFNLIIIRSSVDRPLHAASLSYATRSIPLQFRPRTTMGTEEDLSPKDDLQVVVTQEVESKTEDIHGKRYSSRFTSQV